MAVNKLSYNNNKLQSGRKAHTCIIYFRQVGWKRDKFFIMKT